MTETISALLTERERLREALKEARQFVKVQSDVAMDPVEGHKEADENAGFVAIAAHLLKQIDAALDGG